MFSGEENNAIFTKSNNKGKELAILHTDSKLEQYYLHRLNLLVDNYDLLLHQIERSKITSKDELSCEKKLVTCREEISKLKNAVTELEVYLNKEREQNLNLSTENHLLKIQLVKYQKTVEKLPRITELQNKVECYSYIYFDEESNMFMQKKQMPNLSHIKNKHKSVSSITKGSPKSNKLFGSSKSSQTIDTLESSEIDALILHFEEYKTMLNDEIVNLNIEIQLKQKEWEDDIKRMQEQNLLLIERQFLMEEWQSEFIQQSLKLGKDVIIKEILWTKEQSKITSSLERLYKDLQNNSLSSLKKSSNALHSTNSLVMQLTQRDHLMNWYHSQVKFMEQQLEQQASEQTKLLLSNKDKYDQQKSQLEYFQRKLKEEIQRRKSDMEGFLSSFNILNGKVKHLERRFKNRGCANRNSFIQTNGI